MSAYDAPTALVDSDSDETRDWIEAFDSLIRERPLYHELGSVLAVARGVRLDSYILRPVFEIA
jgi:hypothetical protein